MNRTNAIKAVARELMPPALRKFWRSARGVGYTYAGSYPTLGAVPTRAAWDDPQVAEKTAATALRRIDANEQIEPQDDGRWLLPMVVSRYAGQKLTVLDFGGSACTGWQYIRHSLPNFDLARLTYVLVEAPAMAAALRHAIARERFVFTDRVPDDLERPLVICASGALQYVPNYSDVIRSFAKLKPEAIIVSLTPFSELPTYARMQCNNPNFTFGSLVFNRSEFIRLFDDCGYSLSFAMQHDVDHTHKDAPGPSWVGSMMFVPAAP